LPDDAEAFVRVEHGRETEDVVAEAVGGYCAVAGESTGGAGDLGVGEQGDSGVGDGDVSAVESAVVVSVVEETAAEGWELNTRKKSEFEGMLIPINPS
jgi:hypothetical protein